MEPPFSYDVVQLSPAEAEREREVQGGLARATRELAEASLLTTVEDEEVLAVRREVDRLTARLRARSIPGPFGVQITSEGRLRDHGNAVTGLRNPVAVPVEVHRGDGRVSAQFVLNSLYEGPPTMAHGGVIALVLDQMCGEAAAAGGTPGMTGTLTLRYLRPTPLGRCSAEAWVEHREGVKTYVEGVLRDAADRPTAEVSGVFILPRGTMQA